MRRTLSLKKETLAELATADLRSVAGAGTHITCYTGETVCGACTVVTVLPQVTSVNAPCHTV